LQGQAKASRFACPRITTVTIVNEFISLAVILLAWLESTRDAQGDHAGTGTGRASSGVVRAFCRQIRQ
jgi:hypothetical protein